MKQFNQLSFLLFFVFGGAIIGETVALSMVVSILGPSIISKLYLFNGALLLFLPALFFNNIDKVNRGKLLSSQLLVVGAILIGILIIYLILSESGIGSGVQKTLILILYPISYLSKTILFLTFWTLSNDIYSPNESKKGFPKVAAWGFLGGLTGACSARLLLVKIDAVMIIGLWSLAYVIGWLVSRKITSTFRQELLFKEDSSLRIKGRNIVETIGNILDSKLLRSIGVLYFLVFIAVFLQDYLFWKKSSVQFNSPNALASFQFTFYLTHAIMTIGGLQFVMPALIARWGIAKIFPLLPVTLFFGSLIMLIMDVSTANAQVVFVVFMIIQFARYVVFENAFSPIYQMFFAAVPKEKRGRAKTFLEGVIKPCAIMFSGIILIMWGSLSQVVAVVILGISVVMIMVVLRLRKFYREALMPHFTPIDTSEDIISKIGSHRDQKIVSLIRGYSHSHEADVRSLAVKILAYDGSRQAFKSLIEIFYNERNQSVKETIARSLTYFSSVSTKPFVEKLLVDANPRIRANALYSLNGMEGQWLVSLRDKVKILLFENNSRVQIEAARFLWKYGDELDKKNVFSVLDALSASKNLNKLSAGLYLVGILKPPKWEFLLLHYLHFAPMQVFAKCVEVIFQSASKDTRVKTLSIVEGLSRKHIAIIGKTLQKLGMGAFDSIGDFLRSASNERMIVEIIHSLRVVLEPGKTKESVLAVDQGIKSIITNWLMRDLERVYLDSFVWRQVRQKSEKYLTNAYAAMEDALRDQLLRLSERILDVFVLLDAEGMIAKASLDIDIHDTAQRLQVAELVESLGDTRMSALAIPILRNDEWEHIGKIGRSHFHFEPADHKEGIYYFIRSKNKWVSICAFYYLYVMHINGRPVQNERALFMPLKADPNIYLSNSAAYFLDDHDEKDPGMIEPFELLDRVMSLKKTTLFRHVAAEKLMGLAEIIQSGAYKNGTLISREGEISDHLYIIKKGSLKIVKVKSGVKTVLTILYTGDTYGEIGLFNQAPRSASAIANEDCELWIILRSALKKFLLDMPEIAYNFLEVFSEKLRKSSEEAVELHASVSKNRKDLM
jgi:hypothetical protein